MEFSFDERASESSFVEAIWRTTSEGGGTFVSQAVSRWEMVVTKQYGKTFLTIRGPETNASPAAIPEDAEFLGIQFKLGTFMPHLPMRNLVDSAVTVGETTNHSFWLHGATWQFPTYENADTFVERLVRDGLLVQDPVVDAALRNRLQPVSLRTVQRRFLRATGLTPGLLEQIERARQAVALLQRGVAVLDTVEQAGYADQPHLTRSLKRFLGQTPAQIIRARQGQ